MKETLIIMGSHPRTRGRFDFNRTDCDVWVFNEAAKQEWVKRADAVLQLHIPTIWRNPNNRNDPKHYEWLKETAIPVYMQEKYEDVPNSVHFPKDEILSMLPNAKQNGEPIREVACSPAWALALAIYIGYKRIEIYGVELESNTEYHYQQGNFKYWLGVAAGRGIDVDIHSTMFNAPLYGYEGEVFLVYETFEDRINEIARFRTEQEGKFTADSIKLWSVFEGIKDADVTLTLLPLVQSTIISAAQLGEIDGALQENGRYKEKADAMKLAGGEFVFSRQEFEQGAALAKKQGEKIANDVNVIKGQLQLKHDELIMMAKGSPKRKRAMENYRHLLTQFIQYNNALGIYRGAAGENFAYMSRLDAGIKAAGGSKSEEAILNNAA